MTFVVVLFLALSAVWQSDSVRVDPQTGVAGHFGTWTVTYEVGASGLRRGGTVRIQLPDTWHAGERNSANRLQATDPAADHYVDARVSRPGAHVTIEVESESPNFLVKSRRPGLDGRMEVTLPELWDALETGRALTIPHHTGKFPQPISVVDHDTELRRNFEIYSAHGTDRIQSVEVLRYSGPGDGFRVIFDLHPDALDVEWSSTDEGFRDEAVYYVRLTQRGRTRGRIVMACSSPIWVRQSP